MKRFDWNKDKNEQLKSQRGICFDDIMDIIKSGKDVLSVEGSRNRKKYKNQQVFILRIADYIYEVPFVEDEDKVFFKTIIPSRKLTKKYISKKYYEKF